MLELDQNTKAILISTVLDGEHLQDECEIFYSDEDGYRHYQAVVAGKWNTQVNCTFSLPTAARNIYITVSDGDGGVVRRVFSTLEGIERSSSVVLGNVVLLDSPELFVANIVGVILLSPKISRLLNYLPYKITLAAVTYSVLLVVFLTRSEHKLWKEKGHDALMDLFSRENKDVVAFGGGLSYDGHAPEDLS